MIRFEQGTVESIIYEDSSLQELKVVMDEGSEAKAMNYVIFTGRVSVGERLILNTTAERLSLGSGGCHFVAGRYGGGYFGSDGPGHIMKIRYTPLQFSCASVESPESPFHERFRELTSLFGVPVVIGELHSMVPGIAFGFRKKKEKGHITYIMPDTGAIPLGMSKSIRDLKAAGLIDSTITSGHAFGGDLEAINIYSALLAAKGIMNADMVIITMGPGIVGTGTEFGFSGIEQGHWIDAANTLGGRALYVPRIGFFDRRERHRGVSHHTITVLGRIAKTPCAVCIPDMEGGKRMQILSALSIPEIKERHLIVEEDTCGLLDELVSSGLRLSTMGYSPKDGAGEFFKACIAAGVYAASCG